MKLSIFALVCFLVVASCFAQGMTYDIDDSSEYQVLQYADEVPSSEYFILDGLGAYQQNYFGGNFGSNYGGKGVEATQFPVGAYNGGIGLNALPAVPLSITQQVGGKGKGGGLGAPLGLKGGPHLGGKGKGKGQVQQTNRLGFLIAVPIPVAQPLSSKKSGYGAGLGGGYGGGLGAGLGPYGGAF